MMFKEKMCWVMGAVFLMSIWAMPLQAAERETYYSDKICEELYHGSSEERLGSGIRPDCMTDQAAMEFDWAKSPKHYECIGQALIYSEETGKRPTCVLLARDEEELAFGHNLEHIFASLGIGLHIIETKFWDPQ